MEAGAYRLEQILADHCAPVICGQKAANLVAVERELVRYIPQVLGKNLAWKEMCSCKKYYHVLIYVSDRLTDYISRDEHSDFLAGYGYQEMGLDKMLDLLASRFEAYQKGREDFPHEIGLFLEYPLADIEGFILNEGKNALECGYWKVYGDVEEARRTFRLYDMLKARMNEWLRLGYTIPEWGRADILIESC